MFIKKKKRN